MSGRSYTKTDFIMSLLQKLDQTEDPEAEGQFVC